MNLSKTSVYHKQGPVAQKTEQCLLLFLSAAYEHVDGVTFQEFQTLLWQNAHFSEVFFTKILDRVIKMHVTVITEAQKEKESKNRPLESTAQELYQWDGFQCLTSLLPSEKAENEHKKETIKTEKKAPLTAAQLAENHMALHTLFQSMTQNKELSARIGDDMKIKLLLFLPPSHWLPGLQHFYQPHEKEKKELSPVEASILSFFNPSSYERTLALVTSNHDFITFAKTQKKEFKAALEEMRNTADRFDDLTHVSLFYFSIFIKIISCHGFHAILKDEMEDDVQRQEEIQKFYKKEGNALIHRHPWYVQHVQKYIS
ncbi:hypothetical protein AGDE_17165 [Angomonas deanei]|nr:hypothetical protein AGDE_17165 [Angomonas deanei]|eukprot:EPY15126.1 hypothetical protein AGDE_17165 [Angomonas deanei]